MMKHRILVLIFLFVCFPMSAFSTGTGEDTQIQSDVQRLVKAASKLDKAWPWQEAIPETMRLIKYGKKAVPYLFSQLKFVKGSHFDELAFDLHVEQQIELTLCNIYKVVPESGKTVYGIRSSDEENWSVIKFWEETITSERRMSSRENSIPKVPKFTG